MPALRSIVQLFLAAVLMLLPRVKAVLVIFSFRNPDWNLTQTTSTGDHAAPAMCDFGICVASPKPVRTWQCLVR